MKKVKMEESEKEKEVCSNCGSIHQEVGIDCFKKEVAEKLLIFTDIVIRPFLDGKIPNDEIEHLCEKLYNDIIRKLEEED